MTDVYGKDVIALAYRRPGLPDLPRRRRHDRAQHPRGARRSCSSGTGRSRGARPFGRRTRGRSSSSAAPRRRSPRGGAGVRVFGGPRVPVLRAGRAPRERARRGAPAARTAERPRRVVVTFDDSAPVHRVRVVRREPATVSQVGPATPDHTIYTRRLPCFVDRRRARAGGSRRPSRQRLDAFAQEYTALLRAHRSPGAELLRPAAARRAGAGARDVHGGPGPAHGRHRRATSTTTPSTSSATPRRSAATSRSRPGTRSTSSTGRSSCTSSRWRRRRRSWPAASRW